MTENFKILTYATNQINDNFIKLKNALDIVILPELVEWSWDFYPKSYSVFETLKTFDKDTVVLVCDAYDVLPVNGANNSLLYKSIVNNFDLDKITFNSEKNCYPDGWLVNNYPLTDSDWKYLNAGIYVGKAGNILKLLENALPNMIGSMDQRVFSHLFVSNLHNIDLDYDCKVFQSLYMLSDDDLIIDGDIVINTKTKTKPLLIHGNGDSNFKHFLKDE